MASIKINGVEVKAPSQYDVSIQDLSNAERNANGTMIIERIATKRKIELGWEDLTAAEMAALLNIVSSIFFTAEYIDPQEKALKSGTFYCGDRKAPMMVFKSGIPRYKNLSFNLVER